MTDDRVRKHMADLQPPGSLVDTYQLYIDGRWVEPEDGRYDDIDPATERIIATAPDASVPQVGEAIAAARRACDEGPWADMGPEDRAGCLNQLGDALTKHADEFFALSQVEWGCVANERVMQIDGAGYMSMHAAQLATKLADEPVTGSGAGTPLLRREPRGAGPRHGPRTPFSPAGAARGRVDPDAVELPPLPQRDEDQQRAGRGKYRR